MTPRGQPSDFAQLWAAGGAFLQGTNPYDVVGPGRSFDWDYPLLYPLPAVIVAVPFSLLPLQAADAMFVGLGATLLAWALTRRWLNNPQLAVLGSIAFLFALQSSQWSPLLTAAALVPAWGWLIACKPTAALAVFCAYPNLRVLAGALAFTTITVLLWPWWPGHWFETLAAATHMTPPVLRPGGFVLLVAALWWRRPEARLLLVLSCVPHTPVLYEVLPILLVARTIEEAAFLVVLTYTVFFAVVAGAPYADMADQMRSMGTWTLWLVYVPALFLTLSRPRTAPDDDTFMPLAAYLRARLARFITITASQRQDRWTARLSAATTQSRTPER